MIWIGVAFLLGTIMGLVTERWNWIMSANSHHNSHCVYGKWYDIKPLKDIKFVKPDKCQVPFTAKYDNAKMPKKKGYEDGGKALDGFIKGYNQAIDDCKLYIAKKEERILELYHHELENHTLKKNLGEYLRRLRVIEQATDKVGKVKVIDVTSVGHCSKCQRLIEENN